MRKFIGIDIGDGESAVATVAESGAAIPDILPLGNYKSLRSIVGEMNGKPVVGQNALLEADITELHARFKSRYLKEAEAVSPLVEKFAAGLRALLEPALKNVAPHDLDCALGCPAGWSPARREQYAGLVSKAGFPNLHAVSESRAAFLFAHYDGNTGLTQEQLSQPTLVIDIGSSTTDFAYIVEGKETDVGVFGANHLGGGQLDKLILEDAVAASPNRVALEEAFWQFPVWKSFCELKARDAKEGYFENEQLWSEQTPYADSTMVYADVNSPLELSFALTPGKIAELLNLPLGDGENGTESFLTRLRSYLQTAVEKTADCPPRQIILTGGASRMDFFQAECRRAFPDANFTICSDPEFTIARGLSIAARIDHEMKVFRGKIDAFFESGEMQKEIRQNIGKLKDALIDPLADRIREECIAPAMRQRGLIKQERKAAIQENIDDMFTNRPCSPVTDRVIANWIETELAGTKEKIDAICREAHVDPTDMSLAKIGVNLPVNGPIVGLGGYLLGFLTPDIHRVIEIFLDLATIHLKRKVRKEVKEAMDKNTFITQLTSGVERELRDQIRATIAKVEIQIDQQDGGSSGKSLTLE